MKNHIQKGDVITVPAPAGGITSGEGTIIGNIFGIAAYAAAAGDPLELATSGVYHLPKATAAVLTRRIGPSLGGCSSARPWRATQRATSRGDKGAMKRSPSPWSAPAAASAPTWRVADVLAWELAWECAWTGGRCVGL